MNPFFISINRVHVFILDYENKSIAVAHVSGLGNIRKLGEVRDPRNLEGLELGCVYELCERGRSEVGEWIEDFRASEIGRNENREREWRWVKI